MKMVRLTEASGTYYETADGRFRITQIYDATFRKVRWLLYSQVRPVYAWERPERSFVAGFDTLREVREWIQDHVGMDEA